MIRKDRCLLKVETSRPKLFTVSPYTFGRLTPIPIEPDLGVPPNAPSRLAGFVLVRPEIPNSSTVRTYDDDSRFLLPFVAKIVYVVKHGSSSYVVGVMIASMRP